MKICPKCACVAEDNLFGVVVQLAESDESAPFFDDLRARHFETLRIGEDARGIVLRQHALLAPGGEVTRRAGVNALSAFGVRLLRQAQDDAHQIERAAMVVSLLHGGRNLVIGLGYYVLEPNLGGIVTPSAKGENMSHEEGLAP
jgi:hypothetical protein